MQNDLISRSELIEDLRKYARECEEEMCSPSFWSALSIVKEKPIDYNVEKVVAELDKASDYYECDEQGREHVQMVDLTEALEIVRNGGKE